MWFNFCTWISHKDLEWMKNSVVEPVKNKLEQGSTDENKDHVEGHKIDFPMGINLFRQRSNDIK